MRLRHPLRVLAIAVGVLVCNACGIKGPLYLPPKAAADVPAAPTGAAPAPTTPAVVPGSPSSQPATSPAERKP